MLDTDLPLLFHAADKSSSQAQKWFLFATRARLLSLLAAAFFGLFTWKFGTAHVDWAGVLAAWCFTMALSVEGYLYHAKPERTWYEARAAAESVKTLSWRYAIGGEPFNLGVDPEATVADLFLERLKGLFEVLRELDLTPPTSSGEQISQAMRSIRSLPLSDRRAIYEKSRVEEQQNWYQSKALWNRQRANNWTLAILAIGIVGLLLGILKAVGTIEGDLLTFASAIGATVTAWLQTKQHRSLATAYTVTALELASVRSKVSNQNTEAEWAKFVNDSEEAFSREHTLWKASRGVRSI